MTENLKDFAGVTLLADIGNGTMNLMYLITETNGKQGMDREAWCVPVLSEDSQYGAGTKRETILWMM